MAIITKKTSKGQRRFKVAVRDSKGDWFPLLVFETEAEAKAKEAEYLKLKQKGGTALSREAKRVTFAEYWEVWKEENRTDVSDGWKISQDQMARDYLLPTLGGMKMSDIDAPTIGRALNRVKELGRSAQTRKHVYSLLNKMMKDAVEYYEMLATVPVKPRFHRPKVIQTERDFLPPEQAFMLLEVAKKHRYLGPPVWLQTLSALRVEAVLALPWYAVQWDKNQILICRAWKEKVGKLEEYPKGQRWEYVPMPPMLGDYLWDVWKGSDQDPEGFVCRGIRGGMLPYETYLRALRRLCAQAEVPVVTTHELRHSSTELYVQAGASPEDIRRLLNHRGFSAVGRYLHRTDTRLDQIASNVQPGLRVIAGGGSANLKPNRMLPRNVTSGLQRGGMPGKKPGGMDVQRAEWIDVLRNGAVDWT